jgi:hypothetical protein
MPLILKRLVLFTSITAAFAADKPSDFKAGPVTSYSNRQTVSQITIAADPYLSDEKQKAAFGKLKVTDYDITPVLIVIQNDSDKAIRLDRMKLQVSGPERQTIDSTPAAEVRYLNPVGRPKAIQGPGTKVAVIHKKNPLNEWEIEGRAFAAQSLAPGQSAFGFFYFQTGLHGESTVLVSGLYEAASGKEILFFEIPLK